MSAGQEIPHYKTRKPKPGETLMSNSARFPNSHHHARKLFDEFPRSSNFINMLEVGGSFSNNSMAIFPQLEYHNLDLEENSSIPTIVGDITDCDQLPSNSFDLIVSH